MPKLDRLYEQIAFMTDDNDNVWRDQLAEVASQIHELLKRMADQQQPLLPVVFVTMPDDDDQPVHLQRCFIDKILNITRNALDKPALALAVERVNFADDRKQFVDTPGKVSEMFEHRTTLLQEKLGKEYKDTGLKVFVGEQLDALPSTHIQHLSPLFPHLSAEVPDRRFIWAFTLNRAPRSVLHSSSNKSNQMLNAVQASKAVRKSMEQYLSSVWLGGAYSREQLTALYSRLITTIMVPTHAMRPLCAHYLG